MHSFRTIYIIVLCGFMTMFCACDVVRFVLGLPPEQGENTLHSSVNTETTPSNSNDFYMLCAKGNKKQILKAIKKGAAVNTVDKQGFSPLFYAVLGNPALYSNGVLKIKEALKNDNDDILYEQIALCPCIQGNLEAVEVLLNNGANVLMTDKNKNTVFMYAALFCLNVDILKQMVQYGADLTEAITVQYPNTLLDFASFLNTNPDCVRYLATAGQNVNNKNKFGTTAIMWAAMYQSNPKVIEALIECGADINDKSHKDGYTPLFWAKRCNRNSNVAEYIKSQGGKTYSPQHTIVENTKFSKLESDKIFIAAAATSVELEYMVEKAHSFRNSPYDVPTFEEIQNGLESQKEYDNAYNIKKDDDTWVGINNQNHYLFTYKEIVNIFQWYKLFVDDEARYYVIGANTKPYFYTDNAGNEHLKKGLIDYVLSKNPNYVYRRYYITDSNEEYRFYYYDKSQKQNIYCDPYVTHFYSQGFIFVYDTNSNTIFSNWANTVWQ